MKNVTLPKIPYKINIFQYIGQLLLGTEFLQLCLKNKVLKEKHILPRGKNNSNKGCYKHGSELKILT